MRTVDGYLSQRALATWPGSVVYKEPDTSFTLERPGQEPVGLGIGINRAQTALQVLRARVPRAD